MDVMVFTIHKSRNVMKLQVQIILLLLLYLQSVQPRKPVRRKTPQPSLPSELRDGDLAAWRIPNQIFCEQMERHLDSRLLILPWWHHYCQDFKESKAKSLMSVSYYYLPIHRAVLDQLQRYRRRTAPGPPLGRIRLNSWTRRV